MIVLAVAFDQFPLEIGADLGKDALKIADGEFGQHVTAVFCYKDQVGVQGINHVSALANVSIVSQIATP